MYYTQAPTERSPWLEEGLCDCISDCGVCWTTLFCPCIIYAENGQMLYESTRAAYSEDCLIYCTLYVLTVCKCLLGISRRKDLRRKYQLPQSPCNDCCVHCLCHCCALCQENRELRARAAIVFSSSVPVQVLPPQQQQQQRPPMMEQQVSSMSAPRFASAPPRIPIR